MFVRVAGALCIFASVLSVGCGDDAKPVVVPGDPEPNEPTIEEQLAEAQAEHDANHDEACGLMEACWEPEDEDDVFECELTKSGIGFSFPEEYALLLTDAQRLQSLKAYNDLFVCVSDGWYGCGLISSECEMLFARATFITQAAMFESLKDAMQPVFSRFPSDMDACTDTCVDLTMNSPATCDDDEGMHPFEMVTEEGVRASCSRMCFNGLTPRVFVQTGVEGMIACYERNVALLMCLMEVELSCTGNGDGSDCEAERTAFVANCGAL